MSTESALSYAALILADAEVEITSEKLLALVTKANVEVEGIWADLFAKALEGKDLKEFSSTSLLLQLPLLLVVLPLVVLLPKKLLKKKKKKKPKKNPMMTWVSVYSIKRFKVQSIWSTSVLLGTCIIKNFGYFYERWVFLKNHI